MSAHAQVNHSSQAKSSSDDSITLKTDPRCHPSVAKMYPPRAEGAAPSLTHASPIADKLKLVDAAEAAVFKTQQDRLEGLPEITGVVRECVDLPAGYGGLVEGGRRVRVYISRPKEGTAASMPCLLHIHGGGMTFLTAEFPKYVRWRDTLASRGLMVCGVEFRNAGGRLGPW